MKKRGILSGGHQCGAGHRVFDDKVIKWSSKKIEFGNEIKMISVNMYIVWDLVGLINRLLNGDLKAYLVTSQAYLIWP